MPEILHTLTKAGGVRLIPKAGIVPVIFTAGWRGSKPYPWVIIDEDITPNLDRCSRCCYTGYICDW